MGGFIGKQTNNLAHTWQPSPATPISVEASHGVHVFEVRNYSRLRDLGVCSFLRLATFHVGGCAWSIRFYPCGDRLNAGDEDYVVVGLELMTKDATVTVSFGLRLIDNETGARYNALESGTVEFDTRCVEGHKAAFNFSRFMRKTELEASAYLRDDRLLIECTMRVIKGTRVPEVRSAAPKIEVPALELPEHMGRLLKGGHGTDLTFEVQGKSFPAHRLILAARSPVFKAELLGPMKEGSVNRIAVHEIEPEVFEALLYFVYTDSLPAMDDDMDREYYTQIIGDLLIAADRYAMDRLKLVCQDTLSRNLMVENVSGLLVLADLHNCSGLKDACIEFMTNSSRMDDVRMTEGYARLKTDHPHVLIEALDI